MRGHFRTAIYLIALLGPIAQDPKPIGPAKEVQEAIEGQGCSRY